MALIICPECSNEISDKASACVHCGCPMGKRKAKAKNGREPFSVICSIIALVFWLIYILFK